MSIVCRLGILGSDTACSHARSTGSGRTPTSGRWGGGVGLVQGPVVAVAPPA